jgi:hypothetical protein
MNLEKMLSLAIESKTSPYHNAIDELISVLKNELEATIAKQTSTKNTYKAVKDYIKHIHIFHKGSRENFECLLKSEDGKLYISDTYGAVEFNNLDPKDIAINEIAPKSGLEFISKLIDNCQIRNNSEVLLPSEKEIIISYKLQRAEQKNNDNYSIYIKLGNSYYNPNLVSKLLAMMGKDIKAFVRDTADKEVFFVDELGNRAVLMPLNSESINIRE